MHTYLSTIKYSKQRLVLGLLIVFNLALNAQTIRVEPSNWWVGFQNSELQLLVHAPKIGETTPKINYEGVSIKKTHQAHSSNYLFIDLKIDKSAKPGQFEIVFKPNKGKKIVYTYELKSRDKSAEAYVGFNSSDAIYLITPDRFANGDTSNDVVKSMNEKVLDRKNDYGRHGGDIRGIINNLDYIHGLGFTAIWPTPMLTNDMPSSSYHGYAMTDFYQVDPRFGTLDEYIELSQEMNERGLKLIMDMVANHCGSEHWWMKDLPFEDWLNQQKTFENKGELKNSNHRRTTNQDVYASKIDKKEMTEGWFVPSMPDLNQKNPFMAKYIIQNNIWWIETLNLGGIRQDTYPYPDKYFMSDWAGAIMTEYPNFSIVGEEWSVNPLLVRYWQTGTPNKEGYESHLTSTMDFPMQENIVNALNEKEDWGTGLVKMYEGLANDFVYTKPESILIFPDNHDMDRIFTQLKEDVTHTKMALSYMFLMPRIPQMYYGTEILMQNTAKPHDHGLIRTDFPGGWEGDAVNAFSGQGLSKDQASMQDFVQKVLNYRKDSKAIHEGETIHFAPENGVYVLARIAGDETVVLILNRNEAAIDLDLNHYKELGLEGKSLKNMISGTPVKWGSHLKLSEKGMLLLTSK
ncbi:glycoside hydrolase family 13 protein [Tamlana sp. 2_MG-2023]|uniref:glycoside hydrolase family 13 protein n=1 Tax=unclassified Tamlana TaxID=2614803 RepID=UPI0026E1BA41|nr:MULTISPECIES: glycoside hydrolase family 13 protein [unclassified Tamlana]MDO6761352.1 glycoside hydrolase family 13 protein [Tamlana sp. 2_MG-2023]MDO6792034.1 glycoside hydrolase family 13 protein [Tamlana sp. 1_MG-2023]